MKVTSSSSPGSASRLPVLVALALGGCTLFDTRPAVEILPGGDLVGGFTTQLRVEAGGAPQARILIDGKALGEPIPTGVDVRVDTSTVPEGVHEIVARVEQSPSPRTSAPRRLEIRKFGYRVPVEIVKQSDPWEPVVFEVRSPDPIATVTATARGTSAFVSLPFDPPVPSADRRTWTVAVGGGTLKELGSVSLGVEVTDDMGLEGTATAYFTMPTRVAVTFQQPSGEVAAPVRVVARPAVRVPSATLWASSPTQPSFRLRDVGPSPWNVTLGETDLVPGVYTFEFRRDDVVLDGNTTATVTLPTIRPSCSVERWAPTVTSERCGLVSFAAPPSTARLEGTAFGEPWPGDLYLLPFDARTWRICPSSPRWKRGPATFTATAVALDTGNAVVERVSCSFTMGWEWSAAGGEPVADGAGNVRGEVLAVQGDVGGTTRLALLGLAPDAAAGGVRIGTREPADATFTFRAEVVPPTVAKKAVARIDGATAIAWIPAQGPGVATGLLERGPGAGFGWWPLAVDDFRATDDPAIGDGAGPGAAAWVEELPDGTSVVRVRTDPLAWILLPPVAPEVPGGRVAAPSVYPSGPLGYGPHLAFLEVAPGGAQRVRVVAWDGAAWVPWPVRFPPIPAGTRAEDPARVILSVDRLRAWVHVNAAGAGLRAYAWSVDAPGAWVEAPLLLDPQGGTVRADAVAVRYANDGRPPTAAITLTRPDGQADVRICPSTSAQDCVSLGPVGGAPHRAIALDARGMAVAWTAADGTVHVRTLTP